MGLRFVTGAVLLSVELACFFKKLQEFMEPPDSGVRWGAAMQSEENGVQFLG